MKPAHAKAVEPVEAAFVVVRNLSTFELPVSQPFRGELGKAGEGGEAKACQRGGWCSIVRGSAGFRTTQRDLSRTENASNPLINGLL